MSTPKKAKKSSSPKKIKENSSQKSLNDSGSINSLHSSGSNYSLGTYKPAKFTSFVDDDKKTKTKKKEFDISSVKTEKQLNRALAQLQNDMAEAMQNKDFPTANAAQVNIEKLNKKLDEAKLNTIEQAHADRVEQLNQLKSQEKENLDAAWKENFRKHEQSAQQLRDDLAENHRLKRNEIENEEFLIFHPSREYLDIDRKMQAQTANKNFTGAQDLLKQLQAMEPVERQKWNEKETQKQQLKLSQHEEHAEQERKDLESRVEDDRIVMERTQARSYAELESKFQTLYQIEDTTYNNDKQKLVKKLI